MRTLSAQSLRKTTSAETNAARTRSEGYQMFQFLNFDAVPTKTLEEVRAEVVARHDHIGAEMAARYTRGNVSIQEGAFLMEEDLPHGKNKK